MNKNSTKSSSDQKKKSLTEERDATQSNFEQEQADLVKRITELGYGNISLEAILEINPSHQ